MDREIEKLKSQLEILNLVDELADNNPSSFFDAWIEVRLRVVQKIKKLSKLDS